METDRISNVTLEPQFLETIKKAAVSFPEIETITLFGSRAMQTARKASDIDLALSGQNVTRATGLLFHDVLNQETMIPYFMDVLVYSLIENRELREHINRFGVVIYEKG